MRNMKSFEKLKEWFFYIVPKHAIVPLLTVIVVNFTAYLLGSAIARNKECFNLTLAIDDKIPLIPWTVVIYLGCYVFWVVNYILSCRSSKKDADIFMISEVLGKVVCFICYVWFPCTMVRPLIREPGFFNDVLRLVYRVDYPVNLLPSLHCYASWMCYLGIKDNPNISKGYKLFSMLFALAVCISTVTTKQHVFVDIVGGLVVAEVFYRLTVGLKLYRFLEKKEWISI